MKVSFRKLFNNRGGTTALLLILGVVIVIGGLLAGVGFTPIQKPFARDDIGEILAVPTADEKRENLHLNTFGFRRITVTPSPAPPVIETPLLTPPERPIPTIKPTITPGGPIPTPDIVACREYQNTVINGDILKWGINPDTGQRCVIDGPAESPDQCCPGVPLCLNGPGSSCSISGYDPSKCPNWCDAKPVIYLYPPRPTFVDVSLKVPGEIIVSDPFYPKNGWKNVLAYPNGKLQYQRKTYRELFYEASITPITPPNYGIVVPAANLKASLTEITTKLGLVSDEQQEFLEYWVPRLTDLNTPYVLISVFDLVSKDIIDHVDISPKPDTFIQFIMYYKGLQQPILVNPLEIPAAPKRVGFTAVEWGGVVDQYYGNRHQ